MAKRRRRQGRTTKTLNLIGAPHGETPQAEAPPPPRATAAKGSLRTCAGCRQIDVKTNLRRVILDDAGRLHLQRGRRPLSGRGAYVHNQEKCLITALTRGGFDRAFRRKVVSSKDISPHLFLDGKNGGAPVPKA